MKPDMLKENEHYVWGSSVVQSRLHINKKHAWCITEKFPFSPSYYTSYQQALGSFFSLLLSSLTHTHRHSDNAEKGQRNLLFSCQDIFRNTPVTLELFIKRLIIKTCTFGWEKLSRNLRERKRERGRQGYPPRETLLSLSVVLYLTQPLQHLFSSCWKHMHVGALHTCTVVTTHMKQHTCLHTRKRAHTIKKQQKNTHLLQRRARKTFSLIIQLSHHHIHI